MQSGSYWAYREAAELQDRDDCPPQMRVLWDKRHVARKAHLCTCCCREIPTGSLYQSVGLILDGVFEIQKIHPAFACVWPTVDTAAELEAQFKADQQRYFPASPR